MSSSEINAQGALWINKRSRFAKRDKTVYGTVWTELRIHLSGTVYSTSQRSLMRAYHLIDFVWYDRSGKVLNWSTRTGTRDVTLYCTQAKLFLSVLPVCKPSVSKSGVTSHLCSSTRAKNCFFRHKYSRGKRFILKARIEWIVNRSLHTSCCPSL